MAIDRLVLDTNVIVSAILFPDSTPSRALQRAQAASVLASDATKLELMEVIQRSRFDRFAERGIRQALAAAFVNASENVEIPSPIRACRDPRDDKFLEVAVHGRADLLISGDEDLLVLSPFRGISILTPGEFLLR